MTIRIIGLDILPFVDGEKKMDLTMSDKYLVEAYYKRLATVLACFMTAFSLMACTNTPGQQELISPSMGATEAVVLAQVTEIPSRDETPTLDVIEMTSTPSHTPRPSRTQKPPSPSVTPLVPTPTVSATPIDTVVLASTLTQTMTQGPLLAFIQYEESLPNSVHLVDVGVNSDWHLQFDNGQPIHVSWSIDGCQLYVTLRRSFGVELIRTDLQGSSYETILHYFKDDPTRAPGVFHDNWAVSPSGEQIAYMIFSGEQYYSTSEFQDMQVANVDNTPGTFELTTHGGVLGFAWSPDGEYLAYSDYDTTGVRQLYHVKAAGTEKTQLTSFTEKGAPVGEPMGNYIGRPVWSPDGSKIAVETKVTNSDGTATSALWIISTQDNGQLQVMIEPQLDDYAIMGWSEDSSVLSVYGDNGHEKTLYWLDGTTGNILSRFESGLVPGSEVVLVATVEGTQSWLGTDQEGIVYLYDTTSETLSRMEMLRWPTGQQVIELGLNQRGEAIPGAMVGWATTPESNCP